MKEKIEDIAKSIKQHRELEIKESLSNPAVGRSLVSYENRETIFWITNKEDISGRNKYDINGNIVAREVGKSETLKTDGKSVYKNTKVGEILILNHDGTHEVNAPLKKYNIEIFNRTTYLPSSIVNHFANDILIKIAGENKNHSFQNIYKILLLQKEIELEKENLEHLNDQEAQKLINRIAQKETEMKVYLDKAQGFVRKYAELRYQAILDPIQESIKRSKIFDGSLIINGGPGTGKTTSLIQRIKFLISPSIEEYVNLNQNQRDILFNQKTSWIFYSPSELLALFLRNSMTAEELSADTERVKIWSYHKIELVRAYKLVDPSTQRPFLFFNRTHGENLLINKPLNIQNIISELNTYYVEFQKNKLKNISEIDITSFKWSNTGLSIQRYINDKKNLKTISELSRLYLNLNEIYTDESNELSKEFLNLLNQLAGRIQILISKDSKRSSEISKILHEWNSVNQNMDEDDNDVLESDVFEENEEIVSYDFERDLFSKIKILCRKQALKNYDSSTKFTKQESELLKYIPELEDQIEYEKIGQIGFFKKYFEIIIKGIQPNVFRDIPMIYKKYRREQLINKNNNWNLQLLDLLVNKDKNKRIHPDEQALLLYFVNTFTLILYKDFPSQFYSLNHSYVTAYKNNFKPVIAIDEATDFSIIDLLAINSFRHPEISSLTLSGDIMQRMTFNGLSTWEDFSKIVSGTEIKNLIVSYRQSPTLLSLAQVIYEKSTGIKSSYKSFIEKDDAEPQPLIFTSISEAEKLSWIAERIIEIYKAYGDSIPSIAIFLPSENLVDDFATNLGNLEILSDVGIYVKACRNGEVLGNKNTVRIFSIDKIKGLEFEAVFFHNIDDLRKQNISHDLLLKYLYVGLSRSAFYLGLTTNYKLDETLSFISEKFKKNTNTWKI